MCKRILSDSLGLSGRNDKYINMFVFPWRFSRLCRIIHSMIVFLSMSKHVKFSGTYAYETCFKYKWTQLFYFPFFFGFRIITLTCHVVATNYCGNNCLVIYSENKLQNILRARTHMQNSSFKGGPLSSDWSMRLEIQYWDFKMENESSLYQAFWIWRGDFKCFQLHEFMKLKKNLLWLMNFYREYK